MLKKLYLTFLFGVKKAISQERGTIFITFTFKIDFDGEILMGRVRPHYIKRMSRDLVKKHGDRFEEDFDHNKEVLKELELFESSKVRNRVAGYIVRVLGNQKFEN